MIINISTNKQLDIESTTEFFEEGNVAIASTYPDIKSSSDIPTALEKQYGARMENKVIELREQVETLGRITTAISDVMEEPWEPIDKIDIFLGACPIAPRFLENYSFLLPYYYDIPILLNWSSHEMIHFLYFKKWAEIYPNTDIRRFEKPFPEWVLSEILVIVIGNDQKICSLSDTVFNLPDEWNNFRIKGTVIYDLFNSIYDKSANFSDFLIKSWELYQELDKEYRITNNLTK